MSSAGRGPTALLASGHCGAEQRALPGRQRQRATLCRRRELGDAKLRLHEETGKVRFLLRQVTTVFGDAFDDSEVLRWPVRTDVDWLKDKFNLVPGVGSMGMVGVEMCFQSVSLKFRGCF